MAFTIDDLEEGMSFDDLAKNMTDQVAQQYGSAFADALLDAKVAEGSDFNQAFNLDPEALHALRLGEGTQEDLEALINQYNQALAVFDALDIALFGGTSTGGYEQQMTALNTQFDAWIDTLEELGFTAEYINTVEAERATWLEKQSQAMLDSYQDAYDIRYAEFMGDSTTAKLLGFTQSSKSEMLGWINTLSTPCTPGWLRVRIYPGLWRNWRPNLTMAQRLGRFSGVGYNSLLVSFIRSPTPFLKPWTRWKPLLTSWEPGVTNIRLRRALTYLSWGPRALRNTRAPVRHTA
jgi:hypothetical protein